MRIPPRAPALVAAGASGAAGAFELIRVIVNGGEARGQTPLWSFILAISFSLVLVVAALGLALHRQFGWIAGVNAVVVALSYGIALRAAGNTIGILYMFLGIALFPLLVKCLPDFRTEAPA